MGTFPNAFWVETTSVPTPCLLMVGHYPSLKFTADLHVGWWASASCDVGASYSQGNGENNDETSKNKWNNDGRTTGRVFQWGESGPKVLVGCFLSILSLIVFFSLWIKSCGSIFSYAALLLLVTVTNYHQSMNVRDFVYFLCIIWLWTG